MERIGSALNVCIQPKRLARTHFSGPNTKRVILSIGSIVYDIWVNGQYAGHHDGFEPVALDITKFSEPNLDNTIALRIANKPKDQIGIADSIDMLGVADSYISDLFVKTEHAEHNEADAAIEIETTHLAPPAAASVKVEITPWFPQEATDAVFSTLLPLKVSEGRTSLAQMRGHLRNIHLWDPNSPHLYSVRATLLDSPGKAVDDLVEVVGFRRIEQRNGRCHALHVVCQADVRRHKDRGTPMRTDRCFDSCAGRGVDLDDDPLSSFTSEKLSGCATSVFGTRLYELQGVWLRHSAGHVQPPYARHLIEHVCCRARTYPGTSTPSRLDVDRLLRITIDRNRRRV